VYLLLICANFFIDSDFRSCKCL